MPSRRVSPALLVGDVCSFLIFAALGRESHKEQAGDLGAVAATAAPFVVAWLVVAYVTGAFSRDLVVEPRRLAQRTAAAWLVAWPLGLVARAIVLQRSIPISFALVVLVTNAAFLIGWRATLAALVRIIEQRPGV